MAGFRGLFSKALSAISGAIGHARARGASTYDITQSVQQDVPEATIQQIGAIISSQDAVAAAIDAVDGAASTDAVTAEMIAVPVWAQEGRMAGGGGPYQVRIPYTNPDAAPGSISGWVTKSMDFLPATVGDLEALSQDALDESISPKPGATLAAGTHILAV